jgi:hypothetical protein
MPLATAPLAMTRRGRIVACRTDWRHGSISLKCFWLLIGSFSFAAYLMVLFQVIADLFGIVDLVALAGLFNSFRMMRLPEPPASDTLGETPLG